MTYQFKKGDIITAYHAGFHEITDIHERIISQKDYDRAPIYKSIGLKPGDKISPLFSYKRIAREDGTPSKTSAVYSCDASFCRPAKEVLEERINQLQIFLDLIK